MFNSFNAATGKDLNWFWNAWFFTYGYIDYSVGGVEKAGNHSTIKIKNLGGFPAPVDVVVTYQDGTTETIHQTPALWQHNSKEASVKIASRKTIKSITLDGGIYLDYNPKDNIWPAE